MNPSYVSHVNIKGLWGYRDLAVKFHDDLNLIIGPNASGKTTLINILQYSLTANLLALSQIEFKEISIGLQSFDSTEKQEIRFLQTKESTEIRFGNRTASIPIGSAHAFASMQEFYVSSTTRRRLLVESAEIRELLTGAVPAVWLPVSRRLPIVDEEDSERRRLHRRPLESVDECLSDLLEGLQKYRTSLDSHLSELRREFQVHALETILYDKQHDKLPDKGSFDTPSEDEKKQLLQAFTDVGFADAKIKKRVDEHFAAAEQAMKKLQAGRQIDVTNLFIIPLVNRTQTMVRFARELEQKRGRLFAALHSYEEVVNSFLTNKKVDVDEKGRLIISPTNSRHRNERLEWRHLSSGEKQILILLTQALLGEREPVVYVADEPELSLHVTWQEKLVSSLVRLAGRCQFIIATHSPDVAGGFPKNIINLGRI